MQRFPMVVLSALLASVSLGATAAIAQEAARLVEEPATETNSNENSPDWPAGLDNWENPPRDPEGDPDQAEELGLTSPEVQEDAAAAPAEQGTRTTETLEEESDPGLYGLLRLVRANPPDLEGNPIARPNPLASEPTTEMAPAQPEDVYLFPDGYVE